MDPYQHDGGWEERKKLAAHLGISIRELGRVTSAPSPRSGEGRGSTKNHPGGGTPFYIPNLGRATWASGASSC